MQKFVSLNGPLSRRRKTFSLLSFQGVKMGGKNQEGKTKQKIKKQKKRKKRKKRIGFSWDGVVPNEQDSGQ